MLLETREQIVAAVWKAGVVGAGGGGFPTHVKFRAKVDTVIVNASECEPLLYTDKAVLCRHADLVVEGLELAMCATGAKRGVVALKRIYSDVVDAVNSVVTGKNVEVFLLDNYYPAGDEYLLVYDVTGRIIPEGGIPLDVGVVVNNAVTLMNVARAASGVCVVQRPVTVTGEVNKRGVYVVPVGTPYRMLVELAGGMSRPDCVIIDGGPMMGKIVEDIDMGIAKTTSGVVVLPDDHLVVRMRKVDTTRMLRKAIAACCQCFRCTDLCPRNLLGHDIFPHRTMRTIGYNVCEPTSLVTSAFLCSQCGMCEFVACDTMQLSPRALFFKYKEKLISSGIKNPHHRKPSRVREQFSNAKVSLQTVMKRLDVERYYEALAFKSVDCEIPVVRVPISKHTGVPAKPLVICGQRVRRGDVIAATDRDRLGAVYHAPLMGVVTKVCDGFVEIEGG